MIDYLKNLKIMKFKIEWTLMIVFSLFASTCICNPIYSQDTLERIRMYEEPNLGSNRPTGMRFLYSYESMDSLGLLVTLTEEELLDLAKKTKLEKEIKNVSKGFEDEFEWIYLFLEYSNSENNKTIIVKYNENCLQYMIVDGKVYEIDKKLFKGLTKYLRDKQYKKVLKKSLKCN